MEASEEEKTYRKTLNIEVPEFFTAGRYPVLVNLYWKNFVLFDKKTTELVVRDCNPTEKPRQNETTVNDTKPQDANKTTKPIVTTATAESSVLDSPALLIVLFGLPFVLVLAAVIAIFYMKRK